MSLCPYVLQVPTELDPPQSGKPPSTARARMLSRTVVCALYALRGFEPTQCIQYDAMHVLAGVLKDTFIFALQVWRVHVSC
jgi:hypothetical protein